MAEFTFTSTLKRPDGVGTWTFLDIPPEVMAAFGKKGQVKVRGTVNGHPFRGSALPHGDGTHYLVVNKSIREAIGATQGDSVQVSMQVDLEERKVDLPEDLALALQANPASQAIFEKLSYSHQKQYVEWIESAKQAATRQDRISKTIAKLPEGWNPKGKRSQFK
jgi:hypothetical protein